jgi:hypothetical protein
LAVTGERPSHAADAGRGPARWCEAKCSLAVAAAVRQAERGTPPKDAKMGRLAGALYAVAMAAVIVGLDLAFFRNRFWERLMVNVGIVLVFAAFYLRFFRRL